MLCDGFAHPLQHVGALQGAIRPQHMALAGVFLEDGQHPQDSAPRGRIRDARLPDHFPDAPTPSAFRKMRIFPSVVYLLPFISSGTFRPQTNSSHGAKKRSHVKVDSGLNGVRAEEMTHRMMSVRRQPKTLTCSMNL